MAHFDPDGVVAGHVRRQIEAWLDLGAKPTFVTTADLQDADREWLAPKVTLIERENVGHDFVSYQRGLLDSGDLSGYDEVVICNDTFVGPLVPLAQIFAAMASSKADFWGVARCDRRKPHVQSYFVVFRRSVLGSPVFQQFWAELVPLASRRAVIRRYEVGMSVKLRKAGFKLASFFRETRGERRLGRLRVAWWVLHRNPVGGDGSRLARFWRDAHEPWNPATAFADAALDHGRLPLVKIDTLRHDPYGLGSTKLLALCEKAYPAEFAEVRAYLARTAPQYPTRKGEELRPTPWWLRPFGPLVAYRPR